MVPRIVLKPLVPTFPCFANVVVSLMEKVSGNEILIRASFFFVQANSFESILFFVVATCRFWTKTIGRRYNGYPLFISIHSGSNTLFLSLSLCRNGRIDLQMMLTKVVTYFLSPR